jgi:DNA-binding NarL/FixJ family response regulator
MDMKALIITRSVVLQQGLGALLESLAGITMVKACKEMSNAYEWIESHQPQLILLDAALPGNDTRSALETIRILSPGTQRVILTDHLEDMKWVPQSAEGILIKGSSPLTVADLISTLLSSKGDMT